MKTGARLGALLAALMLAGCGTTAPERPPESDRKTERAPGGLPDAYRHPPK
jgi:hypothetical protein